MRMYDIIAKKRDGYELSREEIDFFVEGFTKGTIPEYQASALLMAIYFRGMTDEETSLLTESMARSGDSADLSRFGNLSVDKHSTGGVGDKTSLIVAPIVASLGGFVTKMSGRGLGHTGGTVDKLESIKGYKTNLSVTEFLNTVEKTGMAIVGQSENFAATDKKLYALRDVTATVNSIPLITSSIMSKKLAAGAHSIVLDVKVGSGAFMKTVEDAQKLAENMVEIGKRCGRNMAALITDMNAPLGVAVGNSLEIIEAVEVLKGAQKDDLYEICVALATQMVSLCMLLPEDEAKGKVIEAIESGSALKTMKEWVAAQGGDSACLDNKELLEKAKYTFDVTANKSGYITAMDSEKIGIAAVMLGAGREKKGDDIDHSAGIIIKAKTGDLLEKGDTICTFYANDEMLFTAAQKMYISAITIGDKVPNKAPLIYKIIK